MSTRRFFNLAVWLLGFVLVAGLGTAVSQQAAPTETKGVTIAPLDAIDLGPEIAGAQGRQFRMRLVTFAPGGDRKSTRLNSSHIQKSRMPSSA